MFKMQLCVSECERERKGEKEGRQGGKEDVYTLRSVSFDTILRQVILW